MERILSTTLGHWQTASFQDVKPKMFLSSLPFLSNLPFPNSYTMRFFIIFFIHLLSSPGLERYCHCSHSSGHRKGVCVIQPPYNCWWSYSSAFHTLIPDFQCFNFSKTNSPPLCCVRLCKPRGPVPCLWITPNPGNLRSTKKGIWGKGNQNETACVGLQTLTLYWSPGLSSSQSWATHSDGNYQEAFTIQN